MYRLKSKNKQMKNDEIQATNQNYEHCRLGFGKLIINPSVQSMLDISTYGAIICRNDGTRELFADAELDQIEEHDDHRLTAYSNLIALPSAGLNNTEAKKITETLQQNIVNCMTDAMGDVNLQLNEHKMCSIPFNQTGYSLLLNNTFFSDMEKALRTPCNTMNYSVIDFPDREFLVSRDLVRDSGKSSICPPKDNLIAWLVGALLTSGIGGILLLGGTIIVIVKMWSHISNLNNKLKGYEKLDQNSSDLVQNSMFGKTLELKEETDDKQNIAWLNEIYKTDIFDKHYHKLAAELKDQINTQRLNKRDYTHYGLDKLMMEIVDVPVTLNNVKNIYDLFNLLKMNINAEDIKANNFAIKEYEAYIQKCDATPGLNV